MFLLSQLCFHLQLNLDLLPIMLVLFNLNLCLKLLINLFLGPLTFFPGNFSTKHLSNSSQLVVFDLARNVPIKLKHYFICKPVILLEPVALNVNFASIPVYLRVKEPYFVIHIFLFQPNPCLPLLTYFVLWLFIMLIQHVLFVGCFHPCIILQVSLDTFLIGDMKILQAFTAW